MNTFVHQFISLICDNKHLNTKEEVVELFTNSFETVQDGKALYRTDFFCCRFCYSKNASFSNVVLSLSKLEKYDHIPCFVVLIRKDLENLIYMINSSFIDKVSHSSKALSLTNIRGSFLGSNIRKEIPEIGKHNTPKDFDALFAYHSSFTWQDNLERLVEKTNNIKPIKSKTILNEAEGHWLRESPKRAAEFVDSEFYNCLYQDLKNRCTAVKDAIICAARIDNVNIRGRLIEILITATEEDRKKLLSDMQNIEEVLPTYDSKNDIGDYVCTFPEAKTYTDIKTKILYLNSNPKAYNIDKFIACMAEEKSVFMFYFVGIDEKNELLSALVSVYHNQLIDNTILQNHWSGRATRGTAQFCGDCINQILSDNKVGRFVNDIDTNKCLNFIKELLDR